jgi:hypothetical protein
VVSFDLKEPHAQQSTNSMPVPKQEVEDQDAIQPYTVAYRQEGVDEKDLPTEGKESKDVSPDQSVTGLDRIEKELAGDDEVIIRTGAAASQHPLSLRDDEDPVVTFRSAVLGTAFACFQAAMNQIYNVSQGLRCLHNFIRLTQLAVQAYQCLSIRRVHDLVYLLHRQRMVYPSSARRSTRSKMA